MVTGVYTITNIITKELYVGSTKRSFRKRKYEHKNMLNQNKHYNVYLQRSYNKYGKKNFLFEILEEYEPEFCLAMEYYWVTLLNTVKNGYNAEYPRFPFEGFKLRKSTKKKMSDKAKNRSRDHLYTPESRAKISKAISKRNKTYKVREGTGKYGKCEKYDLNNVLLQTYNNPYEAFKDLNLKNASHIIRASQTDGKCVGYRWKVYINNKLVK